MTDTQPKLTSSEVGVLTAEQVKEIAYIFAGLVKEWKLDTERTKG